MSEAFWFLPTRQQNGKLGIRFVDQLRFYKADILEIRFCNTSVTWIIVMLGTNEHRVAMNSIALYFGARGRVRKAREGNLQLSTAKSAESTARPASWPPGV